MIKAASRNVALQALLLAILLWFLLYPVAAGPMTWDELLYLSQSVSPAGDSMILNRYGHIYLQMLFVRLAGNALDGTRLYWTFLISGTSALVYFTTRKMAKDCGVATGLVAVLVFLSPFMILDSRGSTWVDYTVMGLAALSLTLYVLSLHWGAAGRAWTGFFLGLLFVVSLKSKETGAVTAGVFLFGMFLSWWRSEAKSVWREGGAILAGVAAGVAVFMFLDAVFLGDVLFSLRQGMWNELLWYNSFEFTHIELLRARLITDQQVIVANYYSRFAESTMVIPFVLYLLGAARQLQKRDVKEGERIVWMAPLILFGFLSLTLINGLRPLTLYFVPAMPIVSVLVAVYGWELFQMSGVSKRLAISAGLAASVIVLLSYRFILPLIASPPRWQSHHQFYTCILYPLLLTALLAAMLWLRQIRWKGMIVGLTLVAGIIPTLADRVVDMVDKSAWRLVNNRFYPLEIFKDRLKEFDGKILAVSPKLYTTYGMLGRDHKSSLFMLTVYFNRRQPEDSVVFSDSLEMLDAVDAAILTEAEISAAHKASILRAEDKVQLDPSGSIGFVQVEKSVRNDGKQDESARERVFDKLLEEGLQEIERGNYLKAEDTYRQALEFVSMGWRGAQGYNNLGWSLQKQGRSEEAAEAYRYSLVLDPSFERAKNNLEAVTQ